MSLLVLHIRLKSMLEVRVVGHCNNVSLCESLWKPLERKLCWFVWSLLSTLNKATSQIAARGRGAGRLFLSSCCQLVHTSSSCVFLHYVCCLLPLFQTAHLLPFCLFLLLSCVSSTPAIFASSMRTSVGFYQTMLLHQPVKGHIHSENRSSDSRYKNFIVSTTVYTVYRVPKCCFTPDPHGAFIRI